MKHNEFEKEEKYKLYRTVKEILHPTISKRNISNYKIMIKEELLPVRVFYPKKVSNLEKIMIYIHGESKITKCKEKYSEISQELAKELEQLVISIDYEEKEEINLMQEEIKKTVVEIIKDLIKCNIKDNNIIIMGDSTGGAIAYNIGRELEKKDYGKMVLLYPVLSGEYEGKTNYKSITENATVDHDLIKKLKNYYKKKKGNPIFPLNNQETYPKNSTLLLIGNVDPLLDEAKELAKRDQLLIIENIPFANHGFLNTKDKEIKKEYIDIMKKFIEDND